MAVMDLAGLPNGTRVFVDTNIFALHFAGRSAACTALIQRIQSGDVPAYVNSRVLLDLLHKMMLAEAVQRGFIKKAAADKLKDWLSRNRAQAAQLTAYQTQFESILDLGIGLLRTTKRLLKESKAERVTHGLMAGDSLHLGSMNRHNPIIPNLATNDGDFDHVATVTVWKPMDVVP
jgi:predicted nucleic acid-binding protein